MTEEKNNSNKNMGYINHEDLVFSADKNIKSGGFSVSSILMKSGISPIMTMNTDSVGQSGGSNKVSDLFQNLAVPNWTINYNMQGGEYKELNKKKHTNEESDSDSDIDDDLHEKLLDLVKEHDNTMKKKNKRLTKKKLYKEKRNKTKREREKK